jgi:hypothetical protein
MDGGEYKVNVEELGLIAIQASNDWDWRVLLHRLGHLVETLSQL